LHIRVATTNDLPVITALVEQLNREEGYDVSATLEQLQAVLWEKESRVRMQALVAEQGAEVIGTVLYYWGFDTVSASYGYHLADIVVAKPYRLRGVGSALFRALAAQCLREQGQWVSLTVLKKNARAQQFYQRHGMVEIDVNFYAIGPKGLARCAQM
jgi:GNAT superfamily N-acetyltransferase